jgi:hypothetical protein
MFETIDASFDRDEPFVLPSRRYHNVSELPERSLDLCHTLIDIVQLNAHEQQYSRQCRPSNNSRATACVSFSAFELMIMSRTGMAYSSIVLPCQVTGRCSSAVLSRTIPRGLRT